MSATTPPSPDGDRLIAEYVSSNGATSHGWSDRARRLVVLGYILAAAIPLLGLVLGIVVMLRLSRPNSRHGIWIILVSIIASAVWVAVFASGALTSTSNELN